MAKIVVGVDPGVNGGVSFFHKDWIHVATLPQNALDLLELIDEYTRMEESSVIYLEQIYLPAGKAGALGFASGWGKCIAVAEILGMNLIKVRPQEWMKTLNCLTRGNKNVTKLKAGEIFGNVKYDDGKKIPITHWSSDSLLIGYFGWKKENQLTQ